MIFVPILPEISVIWGTPVVPRSGTPTTTISNPGHTAYDFFEEAYDKVDIFYMPPSLFETELKIPINYILKENIWSKLILFIC